MLADVASARDEEPAAGAGHGATEDQPFAAATETGAVRDGPASAGARLGVVVVHHAASREVLDDAMRRLALAAPGARVVLVATGSSVPDPAPGWPHGTAVARVENHSYARAVNRGLALLPALPYLAFMNDDVLVSERTFDDLVAALAAEPGAGAAGPLAYDARGRLQAMGLPYRLVQRRALHAGPRADGRPAAVSAPWLTGCLKVLTRQAYVATGGYDEGFRFTNEDLDHGLRASRLGYANLLVATPVTHLGGSSTPGHPAFHVEGRRGGYLVTARHLPPAAGLAHRAYLLLEGGLGSLLAPGPQARAAHRAVARMAWEGAWGTSPFGATLDDR